MRCTLRSSGAGQLPGVPTPRQASVRSRILRLSCRELVCAAYPSSMQAAVRCPSSMQAAVRCSSSMQAAVWCPRSMHAAVWYPRSIQAAVCCPSSTQAAVWLNADSTAVFQLNAGSCVVAELRLRYRETFTALLSRASAGFPTSLFMYLIKSNVYFNILIIIYCFTVYLLLWG